MYKHKRFKSDNRQHKGIKNIIEPFDFLQDDLGIICKSNGCNKKLTPMERLYGDYCFPCASEINQRERAILKLTDVYKYKFVLYRWNYASNLWQQQYEQSISHEQYFKKYPSDNFKDDPERLFYRYDLFLDYQCTDTIYSYSPNLFLQ